MTLSAVMCWSLFFCCFLVLELDFLKEDVWYFWIPLLTPWLPMYAGVWKYKRAYKIELGNFDFFSFLMIICFTTAVWGGLGNYIVEDLYSKKHHAENADGVWQENADYYYFNELQLTEHKYMFTDYERVHKRYGPDEFRVCVYIGSVISTRNNQVSVFFKEYSKKVGNISRNSLIEKGEVFANESLEKFNKQAVLRNVLGYRVRNTPGKEHLSKLIQPDWPEKELIFLEYQKQQPGFKASLLIWFLLPPITVVLFVLMIISSKKVEFYPRIASAINNGDILPERSDIIKGLAPSKDKWVISTFMMCCVLVFIAFIFQGADPVNIGADYTSQWSVGAKTQQNGYCWQLLSAGFCHGGIFHLAINMIYIGLMGIYLESLVGWKNMLAILILGILSSSTLSLVMNYDSGINSIGASGFGMTLCGVWIGFYAHKAYRDIFGVMAFVGILIAVPTLLLGMAHGTDNWAHLGGLIFGLITGMSLVPFIKDRIENFDFLN